MSGKKVAGLIVKGVIGIVCVAVIFASYMHISGRPQCPECESHSLEIIELEENGEGYNCLECEAQRFVLD